MRTLITRVLQPGLNRQPRHLKSKPPLSFVRLTSLLYFCVPHTHQTHLPPTCFAHQPPTRDFSQLWNSCLLFDVLLARNHGRNPLAVKLQNDVSSRMHAGFASFSHCIDPATPRKVGVQPVAKPTTRNDRPQNRHILLISHLSRAKPSFRRANLMHLPILISRTLFLLGGLKFL